MICVEPDNISGPHFTHSLCVVAKLHDFHGGVTDNILLSSQRIWKRLSVMILMVLNSGPYLVTGLQIVPNLPEKYDDVTDKIFLYPNISDKVWRQCCM